MITLDFETTGLVGPVALPLDKQPQIIEATLSKLDDKTLKELDRLTRFINPGRSLPPDIVKATGITDKMLVGSNPFVEHYPAFCQIFLGEKIICAHNCAFEVGCLEAELRRIGKLTQFPWPPRRICTVEASLHLKKHRLKLGDLYQLATGKEIKGAHRTSVDVDALNESLRWLVKKGHIKL
jgi:DNA polymerase III alpha subunit (gram-positive type)